MDSNQGQRMTNIKWNGRGHLSFNLSNLYVDIRLSLNEPTYIFHVDIYLSRYLLNAIKE